MTDTVTMDDLATALREAVAVIVLARIGANITIMADGAEHTVYVQDCRDRWQAILDRYDAMEEERRAEVRSRLMGAIERSTLMTKHHLADARRWRDRGQPEVASVDVMKAREANHRALHLRRQLRALGGDA